MSSTWLSGSSRPPNRERVLRTPLAIAPTRPCARVYRWSTRSASPKRSERRTTASVLYVRPSTRFSLRLASAAVPRATAAGAGLLDRRPAAGARLAAPAVDRELLLHGATRVRAVAEVGPLAHDPVPKRTANAPAQSAHLVRRELSRRPQRMDARMPQGLVRVDVPQARDRPLVEHGGLDGRLTSGQAAFEERGGEPRPERFRPEAGREVVVELVRAQHDPGSETPDVAVDDVSPVVELEHGALMSRGVGREPAGHAQVDHEGEPAAEADDQVLAAALDRGNTLAFELGGDLARLVRPGQPAVAHLDTP